MESNGNPMVIKIYILRNVVLILKMVENVLVELPIKKIASWEKRSKVLEKDIKVRYQNCC